MQDAMIPQDAMTPNTSSDSYLAQLADRDLDILAERLSPDVRLALAAHLARQPRRSRSPPPTPRHMIPAPLRVSIDEHGTTLPSSAPLLSHAELKSILPAVVPAAKRWLEATDSAARTATQQQRVLQEMGRHVVRTEHRRDVATARATELSRLAEQQSAALVASAARCASLREAYEEQRARLLKEQERSKRLERGLRAVARERDMLASEASDVGVRPRSALRSALGRPVGHTPGCTTPAAVSEASARPSTEREQKPVQRQARGET